MSYRVGAFGFLSSEKVKADGDLNVGLLDQRFGLNWVKRHISKFGEDPNHIVLGGGSAGAGSVLHQLIAYDGAPTDLFVAAFGISPFVPYEPKVSEVEWQFDAFLQNTNCSDIVCLRNASTDVLQYGNLVPQIYPERSDPTLWSFVPVVDGDFVQDESLQLIQNGRFVKVPVLFGDDTDEGTIFAPNATSSEQVAAFFGNNIPHLTQSNTDAIVAIYSPPDPTPFPLHAAWFPSGASAYGESILTCPGLLISQSFAAKDLPSWNYRFNVPPLPADAVAPDIGVSHGSEFPLIIGTSNSTDPVVGMLRDFYASFVRSLGPNVHRSTTKGDMNWPACSRDHALAQRPANRLVFDQGGVTVELVPQQQHDRCAFWASLRGVIQQ